ncbi:hypothetical protein VNO77_03829 [Canavalia gladiata]|uniref:Uncharacterized protein n=1 Tax=Canavalia gladiata TaxID=3824 RepID=A0AAN9N0K3_CANGL
MERTSSAQVAQSPFDLDGSANMCSYSSSKVAVGQRILVAYFHSMVCYKGTCSSEHYNKFLLHFDDRQRDDHHVRYTGKLYNTDNHRCHSEFSICLLTAKVQCPQI